MSAWKPPRSGSGREAAEAPERPPAGDKAAALLALRPHFRRELETKLGRAGYGREEVDGALDKLARLGLLNDAELARAFVETVARRKGWGRMRVAQELARRGAPGEAAEAALATLSVEDDLEAARDAARRWRRRGEARPEALARHLSRRGFGSSAIFKVLKEMAPSAPDFEAPGAEE